MSIFANTDQIKGHWGTDNLLGASVCPYCDEASPTKEWLLDDLITNVNSPVKVKGVRCPECFSFFPSWDTDKVLKASDEITEEQIAQMRIYWSDDKCGSKN